MQEILGKLASLVEVGKTDAESNYPRDLKGQPGVREYVRDALAQHVDPMQILELGLTPGMQALGKKFSAGEVFVPEVLLAMKAFNSGIAELKPYLAKDATHKKGKFVLGTVQGDIHDIGKNLVKMLLESAGWEVIDVGVDATPRKFIDAARQNDVAAIGLSSLLTTTMINMGEIISGLREAGIDKPVLVGGAPVTAAYAESIGAIYGRDPQQAIDILEGIAGTR